MQPGTAADDKPPTLAFPRAPAPRGHSGEGSPEGAGAAGARQWSVGAFGPPH